MVARYLSPLFFLAMVPLLTRAAGPIAAIGAALLIPAVLIGAEFAVPGARFDPSEPVTPSYRLLPLLYVPLQIGVTFWATWLAAEASIGLGGFVSLAIAVGVMSGLFGVLAAHELIHSHSRAERALGTAMLACMSYPHFRFAHIHGHHRHAASAKDPTTARLGESFYAFVPRSLVAQFVATWRHGAGHARFNRMCWDIGGMLALWSAILLATSTRGLLFFLVQSAVAILCLALFDYVAHYGLMRRPGEKLSDRHSWNASHAVCNAVLFNMGRHSDHHRKAAGPYQMLRRIDAGPELPAGYAGSMLLALIPPLWRRAMDWRVRTVLPDPVRTRTDAA